MKLDLFQGTQMVGSEYNNISMNPACLLSSVPVGGGVKFFLAHCCCLGRSQSLDLNPTKHLRDEAALEVCSMKEPLKIPRGCMIQSCQQNPQRNVSSISLNKCQDSFGSFESKSRPYLVLVLNQIPNKMLSECVSIMISTAI